MFLVLSFGRSLTPPTAAPLRLSSKLNQRGGSASRASAAPMAEHARKRKRAHELQMPCGAQTNELQHQWEPQGPFNRFAFERSDIMTGLSIRTAAASLLALAAAGCTTS